MQEEGRNNIRPNLWVVHQDVQGAPGRIESSRPVAIAVVGWLVESQVKYVWSPNFLGSKVSLEP